MRHASRWGCVALLWAACAPAAARAAGVEWRTNLQDALQRAAVDRVPVMVEFYADWCGPCRMMDRTTYADTTVGRLAAQSIAVKVNTDVNPAIAQYYTVQALPTVVFLDHTGSEIARFIGYRDAVAFAALQRENLAPRSRDIDQREETARAAPSEESRFALADAYVSARRFAAAESVWTALMDEGSTPAVRADAVIERAHTRRLAGDPAGALADYTRYASLPNRPGRVAEARLCMADVLVTLHRAGEARPLYEKVRKEARNTWVGHEADRALTALSRKRSAS